MPSRRDSPACGAWRNARYESRLGKQEARVVDEAKDEFDEEIVLNACVFPHRTVSLGASRSGRQTERDVPKASCDKRNTVVKEGDTINVLCDTVSFKTVRLRVVRAGSRVVCDGCERSVSAASHTRPVQVRWMLDDSRHWSLGVSRMRQNWTVVKGLQRVHETRGRERKQTQRRKS